MRSRVRIALSSSFVVAENATPRRAPSSTAAWGGRRREPARAAWYFEAMSDVTLAGLESFAAPEHGWRAVAGRLAPILAAASALALLAGLAVFVFGARRALLDPDVATRLLLALGGILVVRRMSVSRHRWASRIGRLCELMLFLVAAVLFVGEAFR